MAKKQMTKEQQDAALDMVRSGMTLREISDKTGIFVETIRKLANRRSVPYKRAERRTLGKEVHGTLGYGGYVELRVSVDGPYKNLIHHGVNPGGRTGYAALHRMRMQDKLGRELLPGEIVHHIDGDIYNNSHVNLALFSSVKEHLAHHKEEGVHRCKESADRW